MNEQANSRISAMIDKVHYAYESAENQRRLKNSGLRICFGIEEPILWTELFGFDANRFYSDPFFYFEQTLRNKLWRWENFPDDQLPFTTDLPAYLSWFPEYTYVGMDLSIDKKGIPNIQKDHPLTKTPDLNLLTPVDFKTSGWMPRVLKWYDDLQKIAAGRVNVLFEMPWWQGCLDLSIQLRGYENLMMDVHERPEFVQDLMKWLAKERCNWHQGFYDYFGFNYSDRAGTGPTFIGDDWINVPFISPDMFRDFVLPAYLEIEKFHGGITHIHSCGNQVPVHQYLLQIKSLPYFEIGPWSDLKQSLENIPADKKLGINISASDVLMGTEGSMIQQLQKIVNACRGRKFEVGSSGLSLLNNNDVEHFIRQVRTWSKVARNIVENYIDNW